MLNDFINKVDPHWVDNGHPPQPGVLRHHWESKQLYSINEVIKEGCSILDYGCGKFGTLRHTLFNHIPDATYYGLDIQPSPPNEDNVFFGDITDLGSVLPKVNGAVLGSIFTHLTWEAIQEMLDQTLPYYAKGFQIGFTVFFGNEYQLIKKGHYSPDTYWITVITEEMLKEYCDRNNLRYIIHDYVHRLDHQVMNLTHQSFVTIK
jgi:hypothetical protein